MRVAGPQDRAEIVDALLDDPIEVCDRVSQLRARRVEVAEAAWMRLEDLPNRQGTLVRLHPLADDANAIDVALVGVVEPRKHLEVAQRDVVDARLAAAAA